MRQVHHIHTTDTQFCTGVAVMLTRAEMGEAAPALKDYTHWVITSPSFRVTVEVRDVVRLSRFLHPSRTPLSPVFYDMYQQVHIMITPPLIRRWFRHEVEWGRGCEELNEPWQPTETSPQDYCFIPYTIED